MHKLQQLANTCGSLRPHLLQVHVIQAAVHHIEVVTWVTLPDDELTSLQGQQGAR
jgi:hypothetical protein